MGACRFFTWHLLAIFNNVGVAVKKEGGVMDNSGMKRGKLLHNIKSQLETKEPVFDAVFSISGP